jgi:hypothetical protein
MPQKEAASNMKRPKETVCNSTDVRNPFLGFYFTRCNGLSGKLEDRCFLTLPEVVQKHHLAVWEFQRIMMSEGFVLVDLPKDGCRMIEQSRLPRKQPAWASRWRVLIVVRGALHAAERSSANPVKSGRTSAMWLLYNRYQQYTRGE